MNRIDSWVKECIDRFFFFQISSSPCSRTVGSFPKQRLFIETCYFDEYASYSKGKTENVCAFDNLDYRDRNHLNDLAVFIVSTPKLTGIITRNCALVLMAKYCLLTKRKNKVCSQA